MKILFTAPRDIYAPAARRTSVLKCLTRGGQAIEAWPMPTGNAYGGQNPIAAEKSFLQLAHTHLSSIFMGLAPSAEVKAPQRGRDSPQVRNRRPTSSRKGSSVWLSQLLNQCLDRIAADLNRVRHFVARGRSRAATGVQEDFESLKYNVLSTVAYS